MDEQLHEMWIRAGDLREGDWVERVRGVFFQVAAVGDLHPGPNGVETIIVRLRRASFRPDPVVLEAAEPVQVIR